MSKNKSKQVSLSQEFLRAAANNEEAALAYMMMSAFGVSLSMCTAVVSKALTHKDSKIITMMMAAGVQVRGNVVFVGREYAGVRSVYPELVIEGERDQKDIFNFSALHICGHILAHVTTDDIGDKILRKAGDCILGNFAVDTEAGKINTDIAKGWSREEVNAFNTWKDEIPDTTIDALDNIVGKFAAMSTSFSQTLVTKGTSTPGFGPAPPSASASTPAAANPIGKS